MNITTQKNDEFFSDLTGYTYLFVSAISFEERCKTSCSELALRKLFPNCAILIDYASKAFPQDLDQYYRRKHKDEMEKLLSGAKSINVSKKLNPYSISNLRKFFLDILNNESSDKIIFDISCLTRPTIIAIASVLAEKKNKFEIYFIYTPPESYNIGKENMHGWVDTLIIPIGHPISLQREGQARGIILVGHEAERLSLALNELEPGAGSIIYSNTKRRPDFMKLAYESNINITKHLLSLKMPRQEDISNISKESEWKEYFIEIDDFIGLKEILKKQISDIKRDDSPLILYPYGPKILTLSACILLSCLETVNCWAVYPVPYQYNIDYSFKSSEIFIMKLINS